MYWRSLCNYIAKWTSPVVAGIMLVALGVACNVTPQGTSAPETVVTQNSPTVDPTATQTNMPNASDRTQPGVLVLTHAQPKGTAEGVLTAPGHGKQNFTIVPIDVTDFQSGGTLTVEITLGNGESDGSFDLFPEGAVIPTEGRVENSVAALYDLKHGESGTLTYKFDSGQVFQFGATGNWFSREGATNTFTVTAMVDANQAADVPSIPALELLAQRPFKPTDISLFFPSVYPSDLPLLDATGDPPSEDEVRGMLEEYLKARYPDDPAKVKKGIALYNNPETFLKISSPSLRAAFVALTDTVAEPAIDYILHAKTTQSNSKVALVRFSKFPANRSNTIAMVSPFGLDDPEVIAIEFNERFQAEMPFLFTNTLAHEALHQGDKDSNSIVQEEVCYAFDTLVYLEQLAYYPELAQAGTWLSRWMNTNALSRLNSGSGSELGLYDSNGNLPIWPDSDKDTPSFDERFSDNPGRDTVSPGNELLKQYLAQIAENGKAIPDNTDFSVELLHWISDNQAEVTPDELIAAAKALKLDILSVSR